MRQPSNPPSLEDLQRNGLLLGEIEQPDQRQCWQAVRQNGRALGFVPLEMRTVTLCVEALKNEPQAIGHVPETMLNEAVCIHSVSRDWRALRGVPEALRTHEVCLAAVNQGGIALRFVPEPLRQDPDILRAAVTQDGFALPGVPEALQVENPELYGELCLLACQNNGLALFHVPAEFRSLELCRAAVAADFQAIDWVPGELREEARSHPELASFGP